MRNSPNHTRIFWSGDLRIHWDGFIQMSKFNISGISDGAIFAKRSFIDVGRVLNTPLKLIKGAAKL